MNADADTLRDVEAAFHYSLVRGVFDRKPQPVADTWQEFLLRTAEPEVRGDLDLDEYLAADKETRSRQKAGPAWIPALFRPGRGREDTDVVEVTALVGDLDSGRLPARQIRERLNGFAHLGHSSYSHSPQAPRYRVILPLARPIPPERYSGLWEWLNHRLDGALDPSGRNPGHLYFLPAVPPGGEPTFERWTSDGEWIDPDTIETADRPRDHGLDDDGIETVTPAQIAELRSALAHLRADDRTLWVRVGHALKTLGDQGRGLWVEWSQTSEKWTPTDARKWDTFRPTQTSYRAVFAEAQRQGWVKPAANARPSGPQESPDPGTGLPPPPKALDITPEELATAELAPRCIVESYLYADVAQLIAPGGVGKTTLVLREAICIALGRPLWGLRVLHPGWSLIVTAEDARPRLVARLREIMAVMDLTPAERATVMCSVRIWDVTGKGLRLITLSDGTVALTTLADQVIEAYRPDPPAIIVFDPTVSFGASESLVNDNEQGLITAARRMVRELDCCVRFIHHTGKMNAREGTLDQYSGRGGSALPDGSRMTAVLQTWTPGRPGETTSWAPPPGLVADQRSSVTILARPKLTYARPNLPMIWIQRTGWTFAHFIDLPQTPEARRAAGEAQLVRFLESELARGRRYTARSLEEMAGDIQMSRNQLRRTLAGLRAACSVVDADLPEDQRQGGRTHYLAVAYCAASAEAPGAVGPEDGPNCADQEAPGTTAPPYRDRRSGAVARHAPTPFPTHCAEDTGAVAAQWRSSDPEDDAEYFSVDP